MLNVHDKLLDELNENEYFLVSHIARYMGRNNFAFPSVATLAGRARWGTRKVIRVKKDLIEKNVIETFARYKEDGGRTSDGYMISTDLLSVFINLKGKGAPPVQNEQYPPVQNEQGKVLKEEEIKRREETSRLRALIGQGQAKILAGLDGITDTERTVLEEWLEYRKEIRKSYKSSKGVKAVLNKLREYGS